MRFQGLPALNLLLIVKLVLTAGGSLVGHAAEPAQVGINIPALREATARNAPMLAQQADLLWRQWLVRAFAQAKI